MHILLENICTLLYRQVLNYAGMCIKIHRQATRYNELYVSAIFCISHWIKHCCFSFIVQGDRFYDNMHKNFDENKHMTLTPYAKSLIRILHHHFPFAMHTMPLENIPSNRIGVFYIREPDSRNCDMHIMFGRGCFILHSVILPNEPIYLLMHIKRTVKKMWTINAYESNHLYYVDSPNDK